MEFLRLSVVGPPRRLQKTVDENNNILQYTIIVISRGGIIQYTNIL